jgi:gas vesicle protein
MDSKKMMKQMIDMHKTSLKNGFSTMALLQNQAEKLMKTLVDHTPGISDEGKKVVEQWTDAYKKGLDDLMKAVDDGYEKIEEFINSSAMSMFQDQTEKMFDAFLNQKAWMPVDLKKTMEELTATYTKGCEDFKKRLDENIKQMGNFYAPAEKTQTKDKK